MSEQEPRVTATDDPELAKRLGFTVWDDDRQQYVAPPESTSERSDDDGDGSSVKVDTTSPTPSGDLQEQSQVAPTKSTHPAGGDKSATTTKSQAK